MGKKISDLNQLTNVSGDNKILIMSGDDTMYATVGNINSFQRSGDRGVADGA